KLGTVGTDSALLVVCDLKTMERNSSRAEKNGRNQKLLIQAATDIAGQLHGTLDNKSEHPVAYLLPGLGDGTYPVYSLVRDGKQVGFEVVFLGREVKGWENQLQMKFLRP